MPDTDCLPAARARRAPPAARQTWRSRPRLALLLSLCLHAGLAAALVLAALVDGETAPFVEVAQVSLQSPRPHRALRPQRTSTPHREQAPAQPPLPDAIPRPLELRSVVQALPETPRGGARPPARDPRFSLPAGAVSEPAPPAIAAEPAVSADDHGAHGTSEQASAAPAAVLGGAGGSASQAGPASAGPGPAPARRASGETTRALLEPIDPHYPRRCRRLQCQGEAMLLVSIAADGTVEDVILSSSSGCATLDAAALEAARQARYQPAATETTSALCVSFRLR